MKYIIKNYLEILLMIFIALVIAYAVKTYSESLKTRIIVKEKLEKLQYEIDSLNKIKIERDIEFIRMKCDKCNSI